MGKIKIIATDKVERMNSISTGIKEYTMFYNELVRKNNLLYEAYIKNEGDIDKYEKKKKTTEYICNLIMELQEQREDKDFLHQYEIHFKRNDNLADIIKGLYDIKDSLIDMHISILNTIDQLEKK